MTLQKRELCQRIRGSIDGFVIDWTKNPSLWLQEIDIQFELVQRLKQALRTHLSMYIHARHSHYSEKHDFARITCEPYVSLGVDTKYAHPDIVIWDDPPDEDLQINMGLWPILWACEIKFTSSEPNAEDLDRLRQLLSNGTLFCGCWLKLLLNPPKGNRDHEESKDDALWIIERESYLK